MTKCELLEKAFETGYDAGLYRGFENANKQMARQITRPSVMSFADFIRDPENAPSPTLATATDRQFLEAFCKRFNVWATSDENGIPELHETKPWLRERMGKEYWMSNGDSLILEPKEPLDGPWQDSLIGPEV